MKRVSWIKTGCLVVWLATGMLGVHGQEKLPASPLLDTLFDSAFDLNVPLQQQLIPLDSMLEVAAVHSPQLQFEEALIEGREYNLQHKRQLWLNHIAGDFSYNVGNQSIVVTGQNESTNISNGYRAGLNVRMPIYELFGRQSVIRQAQAELQAAHYQKDVRLQELSRQVIDEYYNLIFAQRLLKVAVEDVQAQELNIEVARIEFEHGKADADDYARYINVGALSKQRLELTLRDFYQQYHKFEVLVGVPMVELRRSL